ncbi:MAG TPA: hypothetical protein VNA28_00185 [Solirubrobacteraceae bacterium]|nr:hypothetical protein [Solirubrobacteraceae bacterium]
MAGPIYDAWSHIRDGGPVQRDDALAKEAFDDATLDRSFQVSWRCGAARQTG